MNNTDFFPSHFLLSCLTMPFESLLAIQGRTHMIIDIMDWEHTTIHEEYYRGIVLVPDYDTAHAPAPNWTPPVPRAWQPSTRPVARRGNQHSRASVKKRQKCHVHQPRK